MKGVIFDRSLGWRLPRHFTMTTLIPTFTRKDLVKISNHNPEWKVRDRKYVEYAKTNDLILITCDINQMFDARNNDVKCICIYPKKPFWEKLERILHKIDDPHFRFFQLGVIDLRDVWHDTEHWNYPKVFNSVRKANMRSDKQYEFQ